MRNLSSVGFSLEDGFGKQRDNSITTGFGSSFQFDDVLKIAVFDREVCFTRMARLPLNLPAGALEEIDELALIFLFGFVSLRHIVMAMVIVLAMIVKAMIIVMAKTILRCRAICQKYNMLQTTCSRDLKPSMGQRSAPIVRYRLEYLLLGPSGDPGLPAQPSTRTRPSDHPHLAALSSAAKELVGAVRFEP